MKKMQIFEPAMCCSTGLCGVGVDTELLRISTVLNSLKKKGIEVDRFNLTNEPMEFVNNKVVNDFLHTKGVEELPATVLDGEILITGRYPSNEEFAKLLDIPLALLGEQEKTFTILPKTSGCGCSDGSC
ncbi:arsenite efflux transporter metallochaperone ArsD [Desulfosporosinus metallidurans]|uniref:Arsenical resistance operon trans-acting repressor ArsD n=2 Tax=Desulfosporosinus metallidurans TaxID=1888891 RepID=A0A1Q8R005_9FIRM|nr:arsenite efflux transporter metallochaperone ArsD [Desulfosporosinus metallidurans]OLN32958.1 Arsenical resistance operon trans-acting repressor ArsD [Desulfosporosinus metallidurans]